MSSLHIEVSYASPAASQTVRLTVADNCAVRDAIEQSGLLAVFPEIDLNVNRVGIYGRLVSLDNGLREHDRIEIYRPLLADPKDARRLRVSEKRASVRAARHAR